MTGAPRAGRVVRALRLVALVWVLVEAVWVARQIGEVPHYGDTPEYLELARTGAPDAWRGPAYPLFLRALHRLAGAAGEASWELDPHAEWPELLAGPTECAAPGWMAAVQVVQLLVGLAAAWLLVRTLLAAAGREGRATAVLLAALVTFDPLVAHFQMSLMTDGLALSALLALLAAWIRILRGRTGFGWPLVLVAAWVAAAALRPEKNAVLALAVGAGSAFAWVRARRADAPAEPRRRVLRAAGAGVVACAASLLLAASLSGNERDGGRWPLATLVLQSRVVYPHLEEVWDDLAPATRERIPREAAAFYDASIHNVRAVVDAASEGDSELRAELTRDMAGAALRDRPLALLADVAGDAAENVLATLGFYVRWALWVRRGERTDDLLTRPFETVWNFVVMAQHDPAWTHVVVTLAGLAFVALALVTLIRRGDRPVIPGSARDACLVPVAALWLANALVFALSQSLVELRYTLISHALLLLGVYGGSLRRSADGLPGSPG